jgi:hypothetical protein
MQMFITFKMSTNRERPHNTYAFRGEGGGGQRFVTKPCKSIGICTVLRYEGGGGVKNLEKLRTYYVDVPIVPRGHPHIMSRS